MYSKLTETISDPEELYTELRPLDLHKHVRVGLKES